MLERAASYDALSRDFRWRIPARYNIGVDICDRQDPAALALIYLAAGGAVQRYRFSEIRALSNRFANALVAAGLARGERIGILLPQAPETAIAHVAAWKAGLVSVPLFALFGEDALEYRLANCGARAL